MHAHLRMVCSGHRALHSQPSLHAVRLSDDHVLLHSCHLTACRQYGIQTLWSRVYGARICMRQMDLPGGYCA